MLLYLSPAEHSTGIWARGLLAWPFSRGGGDLITPPCGQPHVVFRGFISISRGWMLLCREFIMAENSPHVIVQRITTFYVSLAFLLVLVCCDSQGGSPQRADSLNRCVHRSGCPLC